MFKKANTYKCPVCKGPVSEPGPGGEPAAGYFPFCCKRCRLIDLGRWLDGKYKIPTSIAGQDEDSCQNSD